MRFYDTLNLLDLFLLYYMHICTINIDKVRFPPKKTHTNSKRKKNFTKQYKLKTEIMFQSVNLIKNVCRLPYAVYYRGFYFNLTLPTLFVSSIAPPPTAIRKPSTKTTWTPQLRVTMGRYWQSVCVFYYIIRYE